MMKIAIDKNILVNALDTVLKAVPGKTTVQILEGVLLEVSGRNLKLTGNNFEIAIQHIAECEVLEPGSIVVNAKLFSDIVKRMPDEEIDLVANQSELCIEAGKAVMRIPIISPIGYPAIPEIKEEDNFEMEQQELKEFVSKISFAASVDTSRPVLLGICFDVKDNELNAVTIDGAMMALRKTNIETADKKIIVHAKTMETVAKTLGQGKVKIIMSSNQAMFETETTKISTRLMDGTYVNYRAIIPQEYVTTARLKVKDLRDTIERALLIFESRDRESTGTPVVFDIGIDSMAISLNSQLGQIKDDIPTETEGEKLKIAFDPRKMNECLKRIEDEEALLKFTSDVGPCAIVPTEGERYLYFLLPVKTTR